jgi:hypothetical protein
MPPARFSAIAGLLACCIAFNLAATGHGAQTYTGGTYLQDFNSLANATPPISWSNDNKLAGWYILNAGSIAGNNFRDTGTWSAAIAYNYGLGGGANATPWSFGNSSGDRALGSIESDNSGDRVLAMVLANNSGQRFNSFTLTYDGEQWRDGGSTSVTNKLVFDYAVTSSASLNSDPLAFLQANNTIGYTAMSALDFISPIAVGTGAGGALDGNSAANCVADITATVSSGFEWPAGDLLVLRWWSNNNNGSDHGMAIDNVRFVATPEPSGASLILLGLAALTRKRYKPMRVKNTVPHG